VQALNYGGLFVSYEVIDKDENVISGLQADLDDVPANIKMSQIGMHQLDRAELLVSTAATQLRFNLIRSLSDRQTLRMELPGSFRLEKRRVRDQFEQGVPKGFSKLLPAYVEALLEFKSRTLLLGIRLRGSPNSLDSG